MTDIFCILDSNVHGDWVHSSKSVARETLKFGHLFKDFLGFGTGLFDIVLNVELQDPLRIGCSHF